MTHVAIYHMNVIIESVVICVIIMNEYVVIFICDGALPVETRQAGGVPGPLPRRSPPQTTMKGGHPTPAQEARHQGRWVKKKRYRFRRSMEDMSSESQSKAKSLKILQWNAEGIFRKKTQLAQRLKMEDIDIACIQETHLNVGSRFSIRGYETHRMDREDQHKGGILILTKNNIIAKEFKIDTDKNSEIHGITFKVNEKNSKSVSVSQ